MTATQVTDGTEDEVMEPFHLVLGDNDQGAQMNIGICVNREPMDAYLREHEIKDPRLLLVIRQNGRDIQRELVHLTRGFAHFTFPRPGEYTAYAMVIDRGSNTLATTREFLLQRGSNGDYEHSLFYNEGEQFAYSSFTGEVGKGRSKENVTIRRMAHVSERPIYVTADNFAEPYPEWQQALVRTFYPDNDRNQCDFRRRRLKLPWKVLVELPLHYLAKLVGIVLCIVSGLVYGLNLKPAWKPYRHGSFSAVFGGVNRNRSFWYFKRTAPDEYKPRPLWWVTTFTIVAIEAVVITLASLIWGPGSSSDLNISEIMVRVLIVEGVFAVLFVVMWSLDNFKVNKKFKTRMQERSKARRERRERDEWEQLSHELSTMSCQTQGEPVTIQQLVHRRRWQPTVVYNTVKDGICKPFAR